jgi:hypothetical protein
MHRAPSQRSAKHIQQECYFDYIFEAPTIRKGLELHMNALFWLEGMATNTNAVNGKHRLNRGKAQLAKVKTVPFIQHDLHV